MDEAVNYRDLSPRDPQAAANLAERVRRSALAWFPDHQDTNCSGSRLVIGVAVWSQYDLRLLELVNDAVRGGEYPELAVAVFNVDGLASPTELDHIFPGLGPVFHTPVVGYWEAGRLVETASGFPARQLVCRLLGLDPQLVLEPPVTVG